jgi:hypothetical protein
MLRAWRRVTLVALTGAAAFAAQLAGVAPAQAAGPVFIVPSSALKVEISKPLYPYFALKFGPPNGPTPPLPEWLHLNAGHPSFTAAQRISADKFERTLTFSFTVGVNSAESWAWGLCAKDTLSKDGIGLPGYHGCGSSRVRRTADYLG